MFGDLSKGWALKKVSETMTRKAKWPGLPPPPGDGPWGLAGRPSAGGGGGGAGGGGGGGGGGSGARHPGTF